jgi:hypothetical protein
LGLAGNRQADHQQGKERQGQGTFLWRNGSLIPVNCVEQREQARDLLCVFHNFLLLICAAARRDLLGEFEVILLSRFAFTQ